MGHGQTRNGMSMCACQAHIGTLDPTSHMNGQMASAHHLPALNISSLLSLNKSVLT